MKPENVFPLMQTGMCIGAAIVYGAKGDIIRVVYWVCAGVLTFTTVFMR